MTKANYRAGYPKGTSPVTQLLLRVLQDRKEEWLTIPDICRSVYQEYDYQAHSRVRALVCAYNKGKTKEERIQSRRMPRGYEGNAYRFPSEGKPVLEVCILTPAQKLVTVLKEVDGSWMFPSTLARRIYGPGDSIHNMSKLRNLIYNHNKCERTPRILVRRVGLRAIGGYRLEVTHAGQLQSNLSEGGPSVGPENIPNQENGQARSERTG